MRKFFNLFLLLILANFSYGQDFYNLQTYSHEVLEWKPEWKEYTVKNFYSENKVIYFDLVERTVTVGTEVYEIVKEGSRNDSRTLLTFRNGLYQEWVIPLSGARNVFMYYNQDTEGKYLNIVMYYY